MPPSDKSTVVIASVLKPIDDTRMYEKIGLSLARCGSHIVHIIGLDSARFEHPDLYQHPLKPFKRLSGSRLLAPARIFFKALRLKPDLLIITTHELLYTAMLLKLLTRCRLIYDIRENYYWNVLYTAAFPVLLRPFIALSVRGKELLTARFVDHFLLAEKGYEHELRFPGKRYTIIENKVRVPAAAVRQPRDVSRATRIELLFSGTLAETTGVFTAIELAVKLHVIDERIRLTLIGFCAQRAVLEKIRLLIKPRPFIKLVTADAPIPHGEIFRQIDKSDFGMITYQINPSTMNSIPTKLYEYLGCKLPILLVNHRAWVDFCLPYDAAVIFDPSYPDAADVYREMTSRRFYRADPTAVYWESEEQKLFDAIRATVSRA